MDVQPGKPASQGPANWFTGDVSIDPIASGHEPNQLSLGNVHFTPGARTAWHAHTIAQTLYVTEGEGLVQARGEAVIKIRPGDIVSVAGDKWPPSIRFRIHNFVSYLRPSSRSSGARVAATGDGCAAGADEAKIADTRMRLVLVTGASQCKRHAVTSLSKAPMTQTAMWRDSMIGRSVF